MSDEIANKVLEEFPFLQKEKEDSLTTRQIMLRARKIIKESREDHGGMDMSGISSFIQELEKAEYLKNNNNQDGILKGNLYFKRGERTSNERYFYCDGDDKLGALEIETVFGKEITIVVSDTGLYIKNKHGLVAMFELEELLEDAGFEEL